MIPAKEVTGDVIDLVQCIKDLGSAQDIEWAVEELSKQADKRHKKV